jgi:hypothetical protein
MMALLILQGGYYLLTGIWPLVSIETFQMVTGRKTDHLVTGRESDHWLVMTVAVLVTVIGITLLVAAWTRRRSVEVVVLAVGSAIGLAGIDVVYVSRNVISPIYLADAVAEVVLSGMWLIVWVRSESAIPRTDQESCKRPSQPHATCQ